MFVRYNKEDLDDIEIEIEYDGEYPNACRGLLTIKVNGKKLYTQEFCCESTGSAGVNDEGEYCCSGILIWEDAKYFSPIIVDAVNKILSKVNVCCGGCI